uniref:Transmembrane protein n=1 Tax=Strongyloides venezuelensis TaxID=75913 RepID=A0A0K0FVP6_STRVS
MNSSNVITKKEAQRQMNELAETLDGLNQLVFKLKERKRFVPYPPEWFDIVYLASILAYFFCGLLSYVFAPNTDNENKAITSKK